MTVRVRDVMTESVVTIPSFKRVESARQLMDEHRISALPVVDVEGDTVGIVTATDLLGTDVDRNTLISQVMTESIFTVSAYETVSVAARMMRNRKIHHVVVTHEKQIIGVLSAFDLLRLVEEHRWVPKNKPPRTTPRRGRRRH